MKKFLLVLFLFAAIGISPDMLAQNPTRKALYTFAPGESIFCDEVGLSFRINDNKYALLTEQSSDSVMSLIINGKKIMTAPWIYVYRLDMNQPENSVYQFRRNDNEEYIVIGNQTYGPYEKIRILSTDGSFLFLRMGMGFRHDLDGSIYPLVSKYGDEVLWRTYNENNPIFSSKDGKHRIQLISEKCAVVYDGKEFILPFEQNFEHSEIDCVEFSESGNCGFYFSKDKSDNNSNRSSGKFAIIDNKLIELIDDQDYDAEKDTIRLYDYLAPQPHSEFYFEDNYIGPLQDKSKRHLLTARWDYDYIMVDNQRFDVKPITVFYDEDDDVFGWVSIEDNQLVVTYYKL